MAKTLKILFSLIAGLLLLLVAAAIALPMLFDPNDFRGQISQAVQKQTGRSFSVGDIQLRVFPWLRAELADVTLGNADGFGKDPFAKVARAGVGVKLLPLIQSRQIEISTVALDGLMLNLAVNAQGQNNWDDLRQASSAEDTAAQNSEASSFELADIGGIELSHATIHYSDAQAGQTLRVEPLNFKTGNIKIGKPVDISADFTAFADSPKAQATLRLRTSVTPDIENGVYVLDGLDLSLSALGDKLVDGHNARADLTLSANSRIDLGQNTATVSALKLSAKPQVEKMLDGQDLTATLDLNGDVRAQLDTLIIDSDALKLGFNTQAGDLSASGTLGLKLHADLNAKVFVANALALAAKASGKPLAAGSQSLTLRGDATFDQGKGTLAFKNGHAEALGMTLTTDARAEGLNGDKPRFSGALNIPQFSPRDVLKALGITLETADTQALGSASLSSQFTATPQSLALSSLAVNLDQSRLSGNLNVTDFASQALQFALKLDQIDADRYLPPQTDSSAQKKDGNTDDINAIAIPTDVLDQLNANGTLDIGSLKINGLTMRDIRLTLSGSGKAPKTQAVTAKLYGGTVNLSNRYSDAGAPTFAIKTDLDALQAAPFLADLLGKDYVSGLGNLKLDVSARGSTVGDLRKTLNGSVSVSAQNGAVKGFNLAQILRKGQALLAGQAAPSETEPMETDFANISASAKIVNGVLKTDDLAAASPLFRLIGNGEIDLAGETIQFLAKPTLVKSATGQGGKGLEQLQGLTVPIQISGNLFAPKYKLAIEDALKAKAREALEDKVTDKLSEKLGIHPSEGASAEDTKEEIKQELKQKVNDKIGSFLNKHLKPTATPEPAQPDAP